MQKSVKIFLNTNFNLLVNDKPGSRVKNYTYIYLINVYHAHTYTPSGFKCKQLFTFYIHLINDVRSI